MQTEEGDIESNLLLQALCHLRAHLFGDAETEKGREGGKTRAVGRAVEAEGMKGGAGALTAALCDAERLHRVAPSPHPAGAVHPELGARGPGSGA